MIGRAATSGARRVSSLLDPRRVCSMPAPAPKSRPFDCSIQRKAPSHYRDPSLWTRLAPIPPGKYYVKRTEYEGSSLQASSSSHDKTQTNIFVARLVGHGSSVDCRYVLTPLSFGDNDGLYAPKYSIPFPFHYRHYHHYSRGDRVDCNGVICHPVGDYLVVWNPTTNEVRQLPNSPNTERATGGWRMENTYIACWAEEDDYKVIRFFHYVNDFVDDDYHSFEDDPVEIELYSLKTDSWKNITCGEKLTRQVCPCYADGAVYWSHYDSGAVLMSFDFRSEAFSTLPPPPMGENEMTSCEPVRCNGQLSVITCNLDHPYSLNNELWVMRNGEWVRLCGYHFSRDLNTPLRFARNGEVVLFQRAFWKPKPHFVLMAFDSITGEVKQLPAFASRTSLKIFELAETFVKLKPSSSSLQ